MSLTKVIPPMLANPFVGGVLTISTSTSASALGFQSINAIQGAQITVASGQTFTIDVPFSAGNYQVFYGSGTIAGLKQSNVMWFGALGNNSNNDGPAIQKAINAVLVYGNGGAIYVPSGKYRTEQKIIVDNQDPGTGAYTKGVVFYGDGAHATNIWARSNVLPSADAVISFKTAGPQGTIRDMTITGGLADGATVVSALEVNGNGILAENLWLTSANFGLNVLPGTTASRFSNIQSEENIINYYIDSSAHLAFSNCFSYHGRISGFNIIGGLATINNSVPYVIQLVNCEVVEYGVGGDDSGAAYNIASTNVDIVLTNCSATSYLEDRSRVGLKLGVYGAYTNACNVSVINCDFIHMRNAGIIADRGNSLTVVGGVIRKIGYYDQTVPWATYGITTGSSVAHVSVIGTYINSEGFGIYFNSPDVSATDVTFDDCCNGGYVGSVNATTGNVACYVNLAANYFQTKLTSNTFSGSSGTGKTALYLNDDGVSSTIIKLFANSLETGAYATAFGTDLSNAVLAPGQIYGNQGIINDSPLRLGSWADADAPLSSLYYSSTQSKLVWKDSAGVVNDLY